MKRGRVKVERGGSNVFDDLGFSPGEAETLQLRARLMSKIRTEAHGMTQAQAAKLFRVTQPQINDLLRGQIDKFSLDALANMVAAAGLRVEMPGAKELLARLRRFRGRLPKEFKVDVRGRQS